MVVHSLAEGENAPVKRPLRESLLHNGSKSVFWTVHTPSLPPPPNPAAADSPPPPPLVAQQPSHPGNSKALAVFWDLERFDISGDHERCNNAVEAIRSFCGQFVGLAGPGTRDTLQMKGYCSGLKGAHASEETQPESVSGVPDNAGRRAGIRSSNAGSDAGLKALAMSNQIRSFSCVDRNPYSAEGESRHEESSQMLTDLLIWMLDCTQHRLFVPTAIVISDDPAVASALSLLAQRGAYTILLTSQGVQDRTRGNLQIVMPFVQICSAHMPLGTPPLLVIDHTTYREATLTDSPKIHPTNTQAPTKQTSSRLRPHPHPIASANSNTPAPRPATSPANSALRTSEKRTRQAPALRASRTTSAHDSNTTAPTSARADPVSTALNSAENAENHAEHKVDVEEIVGRGHSMSPRSSRVWGMGVGGGGVSSRGSSPSSPKVPLVGDEMGMAAKMWCSWSKLSLFGVGEAVCVRRSDGRYTLGVCVSVCVCVCVCACASIHMFI